MSNDSAALIAPSPEEAVGWECSQLPESIEGGFEKHSEASSTAGGTLSGYGLVTRVLDHPRTKPTMPKIKNSSVSSINVHILGQEGLDGRHLEETAKWFERHPGPIRVIVDKRPVSLDLDQAGAIAMNTPFEKLKAIRTAKDLDEAEFIALFTISPNEGSWFGALDRENIRNGFGHVDDFSWATSAPASFISAAFILQGLFNSFISAAGLDWEAFWHNHPRGCLFDFCENKSDLNLKLRTADICGDCMVVLREIGIPDALLLQAIQIMDAGRLSALSTRQFRPAGEDFNRWPFPVAVTRHKIEQTTNPLFRLNLLFDHFDCLIRYFYLTREVLEGRTPQLVEHPSLGWWVDSLAHSLKGESLFREVVRIAEKEKVVFLRNNLKGHGWTTLDPQEYEKEVAILEDIMVRIENELIPFFAGHRLLIPRITKPKYGIYLIEGEELKGSHLLHPPFQAELRSDPLSAGLTSLNEVFVSDTDLQCFYLISPYIRSAFCPTCQQSRILMTDGGNRFIDIFMGHRVTI
jgi:hypothetical protein